MRKDKPYGFLKKNLHPPTSGSIFLQKSLHFRQPLLKKPLRVMTLKNCLKRYVNELNSLTQLKCKPKPGLKLFVLSSEFRTKHYILTFCKPFLGRDRVKCGQCGQLVECGQCLLKLLNRQI